MEEIVELGEFQKAAKALDDYEEIDRSRINKLLADLVKNRKTAPVRYRL